MCARLVPWPTDDVNGPGATGTPGRDGRNPRGTAASEVGPRSTTSSWLPTALSRARSPPGSAGFPSSRCHHPMGWHPPAARRLGQRSARHATPPGPRESAAGRPGASRVRISTSTPVQTGPHVRVVATNPGRAPPLGIAGIPPTACRSERPLQLVANTIRWPPPITEPTGDPARRTSRPRTNRLCSRCSARTNSPPAPRRKAASARPVVRVTLTARNPDPGKPGQLPYAT